MPPRPAPDSPTQFAPPAPRVATAEIFDEAEPAELPTIEIQTTVEHRGRTFTVVARLHARPAV
jgi:hypothetical protein